MCMSECIYLLMCKLYYNDSYIFSRILTQEEGQFERTYSEATAERMDEEVKSMVDEAYRRTLALIQDKQEQVCRMFVYVCLCVFMHMYAFLNILCKYSHVCMYIYTQ